MKAHRLALLFAFLSCIIPPLDKAVAKAYPDQRFYLRTKNHARGNEWFIDEESAIRSGMYRGYTVHERARAIVSLLGFAFCLLAFFIGRAGIRGAYGKERDLCLVAVILAVCSCSRYAGDAGSLILFLIFLLRFQQKYKPLKENAPDRAADIV